MLSLLPVWAAWYDVFPEPLRGYLEGPLGIGVLLLVGALVVYLLARVLGGLFRSLFGSRDETGSGLREKLSDYPPPPALAGGPRLLVEGVPVRIRLIVLAPAGHGQQISMEEVETLLEKITPGLGNMVRQDKPRIRIWPPQLSRQGFAPAFHRETEKPEAEGQPSRWVLLAGLVMQQRMPLLLGLALQAETPNLLGRQSLDPARWQQMLRVATPA